MIDQKKLALIHIIKKELGLTDTEYRKILKDAAGVDSAKELDEVKFRALMNYFMRSRHYRRDQGGITLRQKFFIKALAEELGWDESHMENFLAKYYHKMRIEDFTKENASKLIQSLKSVKAHHAEH